MEDNDYSKEKEYDWDKFYQRGEKIIKLAWIGVIGMVLVLALLTHYRIL